MKNNGWVWWECPQREERNGMIIDTRPTYYSIYAQPFTDSLQRTTAPTLRVLTAGRPHTHWTSL